MTTVTRAPAQAAAAGGQGRPPASPRFKAMSVKGVAARRARMGIFDPAKHCGFHRSVRQVGCNEEGCRRPEHLCTKQKGWGTGHVGIGQCRNHFGTSPTHEKAGEREKLVGTLALLSIPAEGDPLEVLQAAVEAAHGVLLASRELVKGEPTEVRLKLYLDGIERAARVAKSAAEAINLDELVRIREREADLLEAALMKTLVRFGVAEKRQPAFLGMFREELRGVLPSGEELS